MTKRNNISLMFCFLSMITAIALFVIGNYVPGLMMTGFLIFILSMLQFFRIISESEKP